MAVLEITAQKKDGQRQVTVSYDFGDSLDAMVEKFGEDVVQSNAVANMKITAQSVIRRGIEREESDEEIQATLDNWKPGVAIQRTADPTKSFERVFAKMSPEEQLEYIEKLRSKAAPAEA